MRQALKLDEFLKVAPQFRLGELTTEQSHPLTQSLSQQCQTKPVKAAESLQAVDVSVFSVLEAQIEQSVVVIQSMLDCLSRGGRIFMCGCGATGRLVIALEAHWRTYAPSFRRESVVSMMAGGDCALVRSIENFEDLYEGGRRHLAELNFNQNDLIIAVTEGGETPYVLGALGYGIEHSEHLGFLVHCNPEHVLCQSIERSRIKIHDRRVHAISLNVGPMALSGSTRMQAATVQMYFLGLCLDELIRTQNQPSFAAPTHRYPGQLRSAQFQKSLFDRGVVRRLRKRIINYRRLWQSISIQDLAPLSRYEADVYQQGGFIHYRTADCGLAVLTDTTERSPTFSLDPFENTHDLDDSGPHRVTPALAYLFIDGTHNASSAWRHILRRPPRTLEWPEWQTLAGSRRLLGFDLSEPAQKARAKRLLSKGDQFDQLKHSLKQPHQAAATMVRPFFVQLRPSGLELSLDTHRMHVATHSCPPLEQQILLKQLLNIHSTIVMGRLGRFKGNVMTWVRPSNYKLIDRTIRYVQLLLAIREADAFSTTTPADHSYEDIAKKVFAQLAHLRQDESVVLHVYQACLESGLESSTLLNPTMVQS